MFFPFLASLMQDLCEIYVRFMRDFARFMQDVRFMRDVPESTVRFDPKEERSIYKEDQSAKILKGSSEESEKSSLGAT